MRSILNGPYYDLMFKHELQRLIRYIWALPQHAASSNIFDAKTLRF